MGKVGELASRVAFMNFRFEKKIALGNSELNLIEPFLMTHSFGLKSAYPDRLVRNVYFDTLDRYSYNAHVVGVEARSKWRLRAYDQGEWKVLEEKRKMGDHGDKNYLDPRDAINAYQNNLSLTVAERELFPVLENRYQRRYFHSPLWGIRVTIDTDMQFSRPGLQTWQQDLEYSAIVEIKYDLENAKTGDQFIKSLPWRVSRYSKFVRGVRILDGY